MHTLIVTPNPVRLLGSVAVVATTLLALPVSAAGSVTVQVALTDKGMAAMAMVLSVQQIKAGAVLFQVSNKSESLVHEFIVAKTDVPLATLPYNQEDNEVDEDTLKPLGEIEDLAPGASGTLAVNMTPGQYVLLCNKAGHFKAGMVHSFTVVP